MRRSCCILVLIALLAAPVSAREEWYDHYEKALVALEAGDPASAVASIEAALSRKDRSGYVRTYGNNYIRYVPYFQLGIARHASGQWDAALEALRVSDERGETDDLPELATRVRALREDCRVRLAPPPAEVPAPVEEPAEIVPERPTIDRTLLERGLLAYLEGDFEASTVTFRSLVDSNPEAPRLKLLLGMALHGAWITGGQTDDALIGQARETLRAAAEQDAALRPDPALCPPRVAALYRSLR